MLDTDDESVLIPAGTRDIKLFEAKKHEGPKAVRGSFHLDLNGTYSSAWNKQASRVFAAAFVASDRYQCKDMKLIEKKFVAHIRTIKAHYDDFYADEDDEDGNRNSINNQANRLRTVRIFLSPVQLSPMTIGSSC